MAVESSDPTDFPMADTPVSDSVYRKQIWDLPSNPASQPTIAIRLIGAAMVPAGIGFLHLGSWLFARLGWSSQFVFLSGGACIGGGIACLIVPTSAMTVLEEGPAGGGSFVGRWIARLFIGAGAIFGVGVWLKH